MCKFGLFLRSNTIFLFGCFASSNVEGRIMVIVQVFVSGLPLRNPASVIIAPPKSTKWCSEGHQFDVLALAISRLVTY